MYLCTNILLFALIRTMSAAANYIFSVFLVTYKIKIVLRMCARILSVLFKNALHFDLQMKSVPFLKRKPMWITCP